MVEIFKSVIPTSGSGLPNFGKGSLFVPGNDFLAVLIQLTAI